METIAPEPARGTEAAPSPPSIAGYEILGELGRGGMGVVYKARQKGLKRLVALKMILGGTHAGAEQVARFKTEAEAVARLQHPHIVQIYEIGEADGFPFFSLEFVDGGSLADKLDSTPQPPRVAAGMVQILAEAVHYAHAHGIVHRDLKPANVLMHTPGGQTAETLHLPTHTSLGGLFTSLVASEAWRRGTAEAVALLGTPKITDFGLAKPVEAESHLTKSGAILGTPSYMAPEQAASKNVGPPADVYALGALLYEMVTGRPPFRAGTPLDTILQVISDEPVPPSQLNPKLPVDLETICLKCLEKEPHKRYDSALALAEDLGRYLAHEPILARPTSAWRRVLKWARRRPALAALVGVVFFAFLTVAAVIAVSYVRLREERDAATRAKEEAERQRQRAEMSFERARKAVDQMLTRVGSDTLKNIPLLEELRRELLEEALTFNQQFLQERGTDPTVRAETARAYYRVGRVRAMLGQPVEAVAAFREAIQMQVQLVADVPDESAYQRELAQSYQGLGRELSNLGRHAEAEQPYLDALALLRTLVDRFPENAEYRHELASVYLGQGHVYFAIPRYPKVQPAYQQALQLLETLVKEFPKEAAYRRDLGFTHERLGFAFSQARRWEDSEKAYHKAIDLQEQVVKEFPKEVEYRQGLIRTQSNFATMFAEQGKIKEAEKVFRKMITLQAALVADFPRVPSHRQSLAKSYYNLGIVLNYLSRLPEAVEANRQSVVLYEALMAEFPKVPVYPEELGFSLNNLAFDLTASGKKDEAEKVYRRAVACIEPLVAEFPKGRQYHSQLANVLDGLAELRRDRNALAEARQLLERAIHHEAIARNLWPDQMNYTRSLVRHSVTLGDVLLRQADHAGAARIAAELPRLYPQDANTFYNAACLLSRCALLAEKDSQLPESKRRELASSYGDRALEQLRTAVKKGFKDVKQLKKDTDLDPLRPRAEFQKLVEELEKMKPEKK
ncbi:MAG TPA: tetratricopeptide repeat-containing serine/threonine-protein kinase [Gemmataceae bacterium]|nr:tetratricopeptide repeat-containing serine/threonine-protein kinase [Gemmataceae bacterium]